MRRQNREELAKLDAMILSCLQRHTVMSSGQIAYEVSRLAKISGSSGDFNLKTITNHLKVLQGGRKIKHQDAGYFIDQGWKEGQPKAYVLLVTKYPEHKKRGDHYQKILVDQIRLSFKNGEHEGLNLLSAEIVMGHDYDVIVVIYATNINIIGKFVMDYLLTNELVQKTHTVMVWPMDREPLGDEKDG
jgi:hypothetical protein